MFVTSLPLQPLGNCENEKLRIVKLSKSNSLRHLLTQICNILLCHYFIVSLLCTLKSLLSVLFYQTTWSDFFQKVSIKRLGPSQKNQLSWLIYVLAKLTVSSKWPGFLEKVTIERPVLFFFQILEA